MRPLVRLIGLAALAAVPAARAQTPLRTLEPPDLATSGAFGSAVAAVPDADGDGQADLLVGSTGSDVGGVVNVGRAFLFSGAAGVLLRTFDSPNPRQDGQFGVSVAGVPDVDGDGRGDVLIGAFNELVGGINPGRAYLFSGATGALLRSLTSPNGRLGGEFGHAVAGLADVNGDNRGDVLVGAEFETASGQGAAGRAYVFSGATGALLHTVTRPTAQNNARFGSAVSGVPDADGDGRPDLLVGAYWDSGALFRMGAAYLFSGATGAFLRTLVSPTPEASGYFGHAVAGVADVNGDGRGDLLAGAYGEDGGASGAGRAYVFSGADGALLRTLLSPTPEAFGEFGEAVATVPDVDGDGVQDLLIGAAVENGGAPDAGKAHLFSGATGAVLGSLQSPTPRTGEGNLGDFGDAVAGVPDVNGDGRGDLLVGAPLEVLGPPRTGRAYLVSGLAVATDAEPPSHPALSALVVAPNPARGAAALSFVLDRPGAVRLVLYDVLGREAAALADGVWPAGPAAVPLDAGRLAPGVYVARLTSDGDARAVRLVVSR